VCSHKGLVCLTVFVIVIAVVCSALSHMTNANATFSELDQLATSNTTSWAAGTDEAAGWLYQLLLSITLWTFSVPLPNDTFLAFSMHAISVLNSCYFVFAAGDFVGLWKWMIKRLVDDGSDRATPATQQNMPSMEMSSSSKV